MDMLNSDWPIGEVGIRTLAAPDIVEHVGVTLDRMWWDRPFTVTDVDIGAGALSTSSSLTSSSTSTSLKQM